MVDRDSEVNLEKFLETFEGDFSKANFLTLVEDIISGLRKKKKISSE